MFKLAVVVVALAAVGVHARPYGDEVFDCNGRTDGYYGDVFDPRVFYSCVEGSLHARVVCEEGFEFDGTESCVQVVEKENEVEAATKEEPQSIPQVYAEDDNDNFVDGEEDEGEDDTQYNRMTLKNIYNIEFVKNVFPRSVLIIGKMNREQKNK